MKNNPSGNQFSGDWTKTQKRIAELLLASRAAETLSIDQRTELNDLLRAGEDDREFAAQFLLDGEALSELLVTEEIAALAAGQHTQLQAKPDTKHSRSSVLRWAVAAAFIGLILSLIFTSKQPPIAVIQDEADAVFADNASPREGRLEPGAYSLTSGLAAIRFRNGVSMTVKAPAEFEIVTEFQVRLSRGQVRASAPETGIGFTIETPKAEIEDLGTEFGVVVDPETGESEIHVFDGQVDVRNRGDKTVVASLGFGDSARTLDGQVTRDNSVRPDKFPTIAEIAYSRWKQSSDAIRGGSDIVLYYSFKKSPGDDALLRDEATQGAPIDGSIVGARWVTGRWKGKQALLFDQPGDAVELEIPGELKRFTFAAWVNVDRLDHALTPVLNSDGWEASDVHLQISRSRQTFAAGVYPKSRHSDTDVRLPLGRWIHVAAVVDYDAKTAATWIDGKLAVETRLSEGQAPTLGNCKLGSWYFVNERRNREFRGRMDEVVLWRRALDESEIRQLAKAGSTSPLPALD